ncbi:MAG: hypothetical protein ACLU9R_07395 [Faecalibacterium sp.]
MKNELKLIAMSDIPSEQVQWLWYPYIPLGKLTIVIGDPGEENQLCPRDHCGADKRYPLPESSDAAAPMNVIYQTAEDGLADTIKPSLRKRRADCSRVLVIDEGAT